MSIKSAVAALFLAGACYGQSPSVTLNWMNGTGNPAGTQTIVYRKDEPCSGTAKQFAKITTVAGATYNDTSVVRGTTYCYAVTAALNGLESAQSVPAVAPIVPLAPSGLTATPNSGGTALIFRDEKGNVLASVDANLQQITVSTAGQ